MHTRTADVRSGHTEKWLRSTVYVFSETADSILWRLRAWPHVKTLVVRKREKGSRLSNMNMNEARCYCFVCAGMD